MIIFNTISILLPFITGYLLVRFSFTHSTPKEKPQFLLEIFTAIGLALGISSCTYFVLLLIFNEPGSALQTVETLFFSISILIILYATKTNDNLAINLKINDIYTLKSADNSIICRVIPFIFFASLATTVVYFILLSLNSPHGGWDAFAIWNVKARFIFRGAEKWANIFTMAVRGHPDYPLLIPAAIARLWSYIGKDILIVPQAVAFLFTFSTVGIMVSSLYLLKSKNQGYLAGIILLGTIFFIRHGASQYADVPLGFYILTTVILFSLQEKDPESKYKYSFLAGIMCGFAAWTKNEGLLFIASIVIARFLVVPLMNGLKEYRKELIPFLLGLLPILCIIIFFKVQLAPQNDIFSSASIKIALDKITDISRYIQIVKAYIYNIYRIGGAAILILSLYLILSGTDGREYKKSIISTTIVILIMLSGYFAIYLITPQDLSWHLKYSLDRLLLHLWPTVIFVFFLIVSTPEQALEKNKAP